MPQPVRMPQLGESVTEGLLTKWLKSPGQPVQENEALVEINTDKVDTEIPSPASGVVLELLAAEGATVKVGEILAWIGQPGESVQSGSGAPVQVEGHPLSGPEVPGEVKGGASASPNAVEALRAPGGGFLSPLVRRIASQHNLDLRQVHGSGLGGRITKDDVLAYLAAPPQAVAPTPVLPSAPAPVASPAAPSPYPVISLPGDEILPLSPVRRAIAEHMVFSERSAPHVTTVMEADLSRVVAHRQANKAAFARAGANLTFTAYFAAAATAALKAFPLVNASWSEAGIVIHHTVQLGLAASLGEAGLIVPVIKGAENLSLLGLAQSINDLAERARARQLKPDEVRGGTFTITNHGVTGSLFAAPIINQPQCAILGVGAIQKRAVVISDPLGNDALAIRPMVYLSLTFDHRILDGALADQFLSEVVKLLQNWA